MRQLELKDICGYFPHRLMVAEISSGACDISACHLFQGIFTLDICNELGEGWVDEGNYNLRHIVPILRPISDLYKTITHNGKEIVPIVELAKIAGFAHFVNALKSSSEYIAEPDRNEGRFRFCYSVKENAFYAKTGYMLLELVKNQYNLFDCLQELKIDYRNLIDSDLAVSVYDLEINPYK